jgi:hypothetical protein
VEQSVDFLNTQKFDVDASTDIQNAQQTSTVDSRVTTRDGFLSSTIEKHVSYPFTLDYSFVVNADGSYTQVVTSSQQDSARESQSVNGFKAYESKLDNEVNATDTFNWDSSGNSLGPSGTTTKQVYRLRDSLGRCYDRTLTATDRKLTSVTDGHDCDHRKR